VSDRLAKQVAERLRDRSEQPTWRWKLRTALVYFVVLLCVTVCLATDAHAHSPYWQGTDWLLWWIRR
jgi:hypothetical protein